MASYFSCYRKYGDRAALLAIVPGLAHFRSREYLVGILTNLAICVLLMWVWLLSLWQFGSLHSNLSEARARFLLWTLVVWLASVLHAYLSAIRQRKEVGKRQQVDLAVQIVTGESSASARTRNLSRSGACLVSPNKLPINTNLTLDFGSHPSSDARVIWSKPTGNGSENLVGIEFARPLQVS